MDEKGEAVMKRYLYTDPLAAAWMAKHYGMRFTASNGCTLHFNEHGGLYWFTPHDMQHVRFDGVHFYIHPDSLHLLEPQKGDVVAVRTGVEEWEYETAYWVYEGASSAWVKEIIQRNGVAFMWPESEGV